MLVTVVVVVYALSEGDTACWLTVETLGVLGAAMVVLAAFVVVEAKSSNALMPLGIFRLRALSVANTVNLLLIAIAVTAWAHSGYRPVRW